MRLSIVVPVYNESEGIETFHYKTLLPEVEKASRGGYEIIYVNDGSQDSTLQLLHNIATVNGSVRIINLSRNFGKEIATTAGITAATGDATIIMDGDGQHPPSIIGEFIEKWKKGAQVVVGIRASNQNEGCIKKWGSKAFYKLFNSLSGNEIVPRSSDFRLIDSVVRKEFVRFSERQRITRGLIDWLGFKRDYVTFHAPARIAGEASYSASKLVKLAFNSFISLSLRPLFVFGWVGVGITLLSLLFGTSILIEQFLLLDPLHIHFSGSALLGIFIAFLIGIVLTSQGIMAVYLSHIHSQAQDRPLYVIDPVGSKNFKVS